MVKHILVIIGFSMALQLWAGNPDRQGEAGAYELLLNPWARSAGLHSINTSNVSGVEALRINVAGLSHIQNTEITVGSALYFEGTDITLNALGFSRKIGKNGALGVSVMTVNFGDIPITTETQPAGTGGTFSPSFINLGVGYSHSFENKISVGFLLRAVSQSISDVRAFGMAFDFGIQYVTGKDDNFKLGISLRNIGGTMRYDGQGLNREVSPNGFPISFRPAPEDFELPSMLNIGVSYDIETADNQSLTLLANFTSNSFSADNYSVGLEYNLFDMVHLRTAYRYTPEQFSNPTEAPIYSGFAAGFGYTHPFGKDKNRSISLDYGYRATTKFRGTHNLTVRLNL